MIQIPIPMVVVVGGVGGCGSTAPSSSPLPAGCPTIQLNFDTIYPEIPSDPTG